MQHPIHLSDGDGNQLRCGIEEVSQNQNSVICGAVAAHVCEHCGPICEGCARNMPCCGSAHEFYQPTYDEMKQPLLAILDALRSRRITVENGIERLRAIGAGEIYIDCVREIEAGRSCPAGDYSQLWRDCGGAQ